MTRRMLYNAGAIAIGIALTGAATRPAIFKSPPWISIESPVNPYDAATRNAVLLVHAEFREGDSQLADLSGTAEGLVRGARQSVPLRFDATSRPNVYALRRQWPSDGAWLVRINLRATTALVSLDRSGNVAASRIPTEAGPGGMPLPRAVTAREVDSTLADAAKR